MPSRSTSRIATRKEPKQARSAELVGTILEAAIRVLASEGAERFTTARVAERAGVSVGSLYQYFPNKAAILFRLQSDEWHETTAMLARILDDGSQPPPERLRRLVHAFVRSECEEASYRVALADAAPLYRDAPEAHAARAEGNRTIARFFAEALPHSDAPTRALVADLVSTTMATVGKEFSETQRTETEIAAYASAMADMVCAYLALHSEQAAGARASPD